MLSMISAPFQGSKRCCRYPVSLNKIRHIQRLCGNKSVYIVFRKLHMFGAMCMTSHRLLRICHYAQTSALCSPASSSTSPCAGNMTQKMCSISLVMHDFCAFSRV